ncbi:hypothetical protein EMPS_06790 [Entomortierella parvispora]|uniref:Uncharacterized protein n=1 Tax=Entomortierella parvispora TaxID=205924 RepID=A0A9P3HDM8_9FUNG|nr:hypothetical protein EMPS_06790 [Entomortierella parvispora]
MEEREFDIVGQIQRQDRGQDQGQDRGQDQDQHYSLQSRREMLQGSHEAHEAWYSAYEGESILVTFVIDMERVHGSQTGESVIAILEKVTQSWGL